MLTWEMIKKLTDDQQIGKTSFFITVEDPENPILCFLRPESGSIEFRLFDIWKPDFVTDNVIVYPTYKWEELTNEDADIWLKGNILRFYPFL